MDRVSRLKTLEPRAISRVTRPDPTPHVHSRPKARRATPAGAVIRASHAQQRRLGSHAPVHATSRRCCRRPQIRCPRGRRLEQHLRRPHADRPAVERIRGRQLHPGGLPADESFADAICCDSFFRPFAEPSGFFAEPDVALFDKLDPKGETTFYDSVCGIPLFTAPRNRTFAVWRAESEEHGWPSFRDAEVLDGAVTIDPATGIVFSKCGTHLGSYLPDSEGDRYCLDIACLSGNAQ